MRNSLRNRRWIGIATAAVLLAPMSALAQREVHWQVNPTGFPSNVFVFVDVESGGAFKTDLKGDAFSLSIDEFAGDQGGYILNRNSVGAGQTGADVLIVVDNSSSYTGTFSMAKRVLQQVVGSLDANRDRVALAVTPTAGGFEEATLTVPFTNDPAALTQAVDALRPLPSGDRTGARLCNALSAGLRFFPESPSNRYRAVILVTGGADKGEGEGECVQDSFKAGLVPFFPMVFKLDKKYDDPRNAHKIENKTHELAQKTGGRSIFRQNENSYAGFSGLFWSRIRSQYALQIMFPCYRPIPTTEHLSLLKVEGRDADPIQFQATSAPAPEPAITAVYPKDGVTKQAVEDGKAEITVDGTGFCGEPGTVKVLLKDMPATTKSQTPFRVVATLMAGHETGKVKVINRFGKNGESEAPFLVVKGPKGAAASITLIFMTIGLVLFAALAILLVAMRSRKAKTGAKPRTVAKPRESDVPTPQAAAAKTMAMSSIDSAWAELQDGTKIELVPGDNMVGRESTCRIRLTVTGVSREHARIDLDDTHGLLWVEDLGSTNGTYYGKGQTPKEDTVRLEKKKLISSGDAIWIGGEKILLVFEGGVQGEG